MPLLFLIAAFAAAAVLPAGKPHRCIAGSIVALTTSCEVRS